MSEPEPMEPEEAEQMFEQNEQNPLDKIKNLEEKYGRYVIYVLLWLVIVFQFYLYTDFSGKEHSHDYAGEYHSHAFEYADDSHSHDAENIAWDYGASLKEKISDLDYANKNHKHPKLQKLARMTDEEKKNKNIKLGEDVYNKAVKTKDVKEDFQLQAKELLNLFKQKPVIANKKYKGQFVEITGTIVGLKGNTSKKVVADLIIMLGKGTKVYIAGNIHKGTKKYTKKQTNIKMYEKGERITIRGRIAGYSNKIVILDPALVLNLLPKKFR